MLRFAPVALGNCRFILKSSAKLLRSLFGTRCFRNISPELLLATPLIQVHPHPCSDFHIQVKTPSTRKQEINKNQRQGAQSLECPRLLLLCLWSIPVHVQSLHTPTHSVSSPLGSVRRCVSTNLCTATPHRFVSEFLRIDV